jgi:hypothetical protein
MLKKATNMSSFKNLKVVFQPFLVDEREKFKCHSKEHAKFD